LLKKGGILSFVPSGLVSLSAEPVEKVQMANSDNFCAVKNQQLTGDRKPQSAQI
jgi:hypothetical protein